MADVAPATRSATTEDAPHWRAAKRLRREYPHWVVIWLASLCCYQAYPLLPAPRGTALTAATPEQLADQMNQFLQATPGPRASSRNQPRSS